MYKYNVIQSNIFKYDATWRQESVTDMVSTVDTNVSVDTKPKRQRKNKSGVDVMDYMGTNYPAPIKRG